LWTAFGLAREAVRVTNPDVGGGFGMKGMTYPEYFAISAAAMQLGRPVRWMSDRTEAMLSDNAGRDLVSETELAFDADHRMVAYRVRNVSNLGAYNSGYAQHIQSSLFAKVLMGVYDCQRPGSTCRGCSRTPRRWTPIGARGGPRRSSRWSARWTMPRG
jgi:aerobic carbon-monoxide dehydrogenase large subunit